MRQRQTVKSGWRQSGQRSPRLRWLWLVNAVMIAALALWLLLANSSVQSQEQAIQQAWTQFIQPFPQESNAAAAELDRLATDLEADEMLESLSSYFSDQINQPNDAIASPPEALQRYLTQKSTQIAALKTHLLTSELPRWGADYPDQLPDYSFALPSFLNQVTLQRILLLTALEQDQLGQSTAAQETIAASWKITQAVSEQPTLIAQLVAVIGMNEHSRVLRKLDRLPLNWQKSLKAPDLVQSMATALKFESFGSTGTLKSYLLIEPETLAELKLSRSPFFRLQRLFQQPYLRLAAINQVQTMQRVLDELPQQNFCAFDADSFPAGVKVEAAWWNSLGQIVPSFLGQFPRLTKALIHWELTQKILQIKALAIASNRPPQSIPEIEASAVCPELRWAYQVAADGTMSIALSNPPDWFTVTERDLPISYSFRMADL